MQAEPDAACPAGSVGLNGDSDEIAAAGSMIAGPYAEFGQLDADNRRLFAQNYTASAG